MRRTEWPAALDGDLSIYNADDCMVATLETPRVDDRRMQVLFPIFDVRVRTFGDGFLVTGFRINADTQPVRECRQAWFCLPRARHID